MRVTFKKRPPKGKLTREQVIAIIYGREDQPANLPVLPPKSIDFVIIREGDVFVSAAVNIDIASQGETKEEAEANLREAISLYYADQIEMIADRFSEIEVISQGRLAPEKLVHA